MINEEIYNKLQNYKSIDRIQLVRAEYKGTNEGFNEQLTNIINKLQSDYDFKYYERLNDLCMMLDTAENQNDTSAISNLKSQTVSHEKTINNPFLVLLRNDIEDYIKQTENQQLEKKGVLTNESYYTILENCTIEAFECLNLKKLYPNNGTKAGWDVSGFEILESKLPTEIIKESYIKENMSTTFLMALDRHWKKFENKHEITRDYFYKKCYQSLLFKISNSPLWHEPDFGFDINAEPCKLNFIWNMRFDIEARSIKHQPQQPEPPQQTKTVNPDEALLKNEYIEIFKNDLGFTLFTKMFELYKSDNKDLANFSFLFFAMEKDFLVCSQVDFVKFLEIEKYNVSIEKIDNRQFKWQINKKSKLYNSIKEPLQKKHEKSTI